MTRALRFAFSLKSTVILYSAGIPFLTQNFSMFSLSSFIKAMLMVDKELANDFNYTHRKTLGHLYCNT